MQDCAESKDRPEKTQVLPLTFLEGLGLMAEDDFSLHTALFGNETLLALD